MHLLDMRTINILFLLCSIFIAFIFRIIWKRNRRFYSGIGFWFLDFACLSIGLIFNGTREVLPVWVPAVIGNLIILIGTICLLVGFGFFYHVKVHLMPNIILAIIQVCLMSWFVFVQPSLMIRTIVLSFALGFVKLQSLWIIFLRDKKTFPEPTTLLTITLSGLLICSFLRIPLSLVKQPGRFFFSNYTIFDALIMALYMVLVIVLSFGLLMLINQRNLDSHKIALIRAEESERRFSKLFHESPVSYALISLNDDVCMDVNHKFTQMFEVNKEKILNTHINTSFIWKDVNDYEQIKKNVVSSFVSVENEADLFTTSRKLIFGLIFAAYIKIDPEGYMFMGFLDMTYKRDHQLSLMESRQRIQFLLDSVPVSIFVISTAGYFHEINQFAQKRYGYSKEEFQEMLSFEINKNGHEENKQVIYTSSKSNETTFRCEHRSKSNDIFLVEVLEKYILFDGEPCTLWVARDVLDETT